MNSLLGTSGWTLLENDLRVNLKDQLIDLDKDWHKYLPGGTIRFH
ncbi:MAG: hypothetical protein WAN04_04735 [Candidatus Udaeobacter sp.]